MYSSFPGVMRKLFGRALSAAARIPAGGPTNIYSRFIKLTFIAQFRET